MRTITKVLLAFGLAAGAASFGLANTDSAKAQGFSINAPGVHVRIGHRHHYRHYRRGYRAYAYSPYRYGPYYNRVPGCPYGYTVQDGVCKPYRGY